MYAWVHMYACADMLGVQRYTEVTVRYEFGTMKGKQKTKMQKAITMFQVVPLVS